MPRKPMVILTEAMFYVLMAFRDGEMCGTDVADRIDRLTEGRVQIGPATLYTILGKFEKEKYIRETQVKGRKRTYAITDKGREAYAAELRRLENCIADAGRTVPAGKEKHEQEVCAGQDLSSADPVPVL